MKMFLDFVLKVFEMSFKFYVGFFKGLLIMVSIPLLFVLGLAGITFLG